MSGSISLIVQNPAAENQAVVFVSTEAILHVQLRNDTGTGIQLTSGCTLNIYLPYYFNSAQVGDMVIQGISQEHWVFNTNPSALVLSLVYDGSGTWAQGTDLTFDIQHVVTDAQPDIDTVQINFLNFTGQGIPMQLSMPLALSLPSIPVNQNLAETLQVSLDNLGTVFVSTESNPLSNTISLNLKNTGPTDLYCGKTMWTGKPKVTVSFVYGVTSGSLAPDQKDHTSSIDSAWSISGAIAIDQTDGWAIDNPSPSGQQNAPVWSLMPVTTNMAILGTGDKANVTFVFSHIISLTPAGHTQMYIQFSDFPADADTRYNDRVFVIDITKKNPPPKGVIYFHPLQAELMIDNPGEPVAAYLSWQLFDIYKAKLTALHYPDLVNKEFQYSDPLVTGSQAVDLSTFYAANEVTFDLSLYNQDGSAAGGAQTKVAIDYPAMEVRKFEVAATYDSKNPNISIEIYPIQVLKRDTDGLPYVTLSMNGILFKAKNQGTDPALFIFSGQYKDLFSPALSVGTTYQFQLQATPTYGDAITELCDYACLEDWIIAAGTTVTYGSANDKIYGAIRVMGKMIVNGTATLRARYFELATGAVIDGAGKGYAGGGYNTKGEGPGGGAGYTTGCGGGGHNGKGGMGDKGAGGAAYDSRTGPVLPGSGGGGGNNGSGGSGGAAVRIDASGMVFLSGSISCRAYPPANTYSGYSGGGAGGAIWITGGQLSGKGTLDVTGGNGHVASMNGGASGGGSGGIILVQGQDISQLSLTVKNAGGEGDPYGGVDGRGGSNGGAGGYHLIEEI